MTVIILLTILIIMSIINFICLFYIGIYLVDFREKSKFVIPKKSIQNPENEIKLRYEGSREI